MGGSVSTSSSSSSTSLIMGDTDPLFELRNLFLIGNYQAAINEGLTLDHLPEAYKVERDVIIYRSYIAKGDYNIVLEEIKDSNPNAALVAVKALASYLSSERDKDIVLTTIKSWPSDPRMVNNDVVQLVSGLISFYEENYDEVFRALHQSRSPDSTWRRRSSAPCRASTMTPPLHNSPPPGLTSPSVERSSRRRSSSSQSSPRSGTRRRSCSTAWPRFISRGSTSPRTPKSSSSRPWRRTPMTRTRW